jgi:predicted ribosome quality control (RQC) complex YloA/Tae2 family protein
MNYREYETSKGTKVIAGKTAEQNEKLVRKFIRKSNIIMHTAKPGSPFSVLLGKIKKGDLKEVAIFTARYSRDWKKNKGNVEVHVFRGKDIFKGKGMKIGTFGIKKFKKIKVKKEDILKS